jgi:excisionase family DNA binding protein
MLSPQKAAEEAGVSRRTIMVAIESQQLKAHRNNKNHWKIRPEDLEEWLQERGTFKKPTISDSSSDSNSEISLKIKLVEVETKLEAAERTIENLQNEKEAWKQQAENLTETIKNISTEPKPKQPRKILGAFDRFFKDF